MEKLTRPLSGTGKNIKYKYTEDEIKFIWGESKYAIDKKIIDDILTSFFIDEEGWYSLGAKEDNPIKDGMGQYLQQHLLSPRFATPIAAIMVQEGLLTYKGKKPIKLKKI